MAKTVLATAPKTKVAAVTHKGGDNYAKARKCLETIGDSTYDFDIYLAKIYAGEEWTTRGYETFEESCQKELGMGYRTALNHVAAGQAILKYGIAKEQAASIGWTNFVEISSLFKPEMKKSEIDGLIKKAGKMTHDEVQKFKKEVRHSMVGGTPQTRVKMTFTFLDEQAQVVQEALNMAKELMGLDYDDLALEYVLVEWMSNHDPAAASEIKARLKGEMEEEATEEEEAPKPPRKERADKGVRGKKKAEVEEEEGEEEEAEPAEITEAEAVAEDDDDDDLGI